VTASLGPRFRGDERRIEAVIPGPGRRDDSKATIAYNAAIH
jgi:hypothetical protein